MQDETAEARVDVLFTGSEDRELATAGACGVIPAAGVATTLPATHERKCSGEVSATEPDETSANCGSSTRVRCWSAQMSVIIMSVSVFQATEASRNPAMASSDDAVAHRRYVRRGNAASRQQSPVGGWCYPELGSTLLVQTQDAADGEHEEQTRVLLREVSDHFFRGRDDPFQRLFVANDGEQRTMMELWSEQHVTQ